MSMDHRKHVCKKLTQLAEGHSHVGRVAIGKLSRVLWGQISCGRSGRKGAARQSAQIDRDEHLAFWAGCRVGREGRGGTIGARLSRGLASLG